MTDHFKLALQWYEHKADVLINQCKTKYSLNRPKGREWDQFPVVPDPVEKCFVTIEEWLDVWGTMVGKARKINDLQMWLQFYPKTLFDTINRSGSGVISKRELQLFFTAFLDVGIWEKTISARLLTGLSQQWRPMGMLSLTIIFTNYLSSTFCLANNPMDPVSSYSEWWRQTLVIVCFQSIIALWLNMNQK